MIFLDHFSQLISEGMVFSNGVRSFSIGQVKGLRVVVSSKKKSSSQFRVVFADSSGDLLFFFAELPKITGGLDVEPELGALFEKFAEFEGHFGSDAAATENDFVDASRADAECTREGVLGDAHGCEIVFEQNFTGCDSGLHSLYPIAL